MKIAGIGFRKGASEAALAAALDAAGGPAGLDALASIAGKADQEPLVSFGARLGLPVLAIDANMIAAQQTPTQSERIRRMHGTGSVAEAAALAACGAGARLVAPRAVSPDRTATAAIAYSGDQQ